MKNITEELKKEMSQIDDIRAYLKANFECSLRNNNLYPDLNQDQIIDGLIYSISRRFNSIEKRLEALEKTED